MGVFEILQKEWVNARQSWEKLSRDFELGEVTYTGTKRFVYISDGRKHFPIDDGVKRVKGWTTPHTLSLMVKEQLIGADDEIFVQFERAPTLAGVIGKLSDISSVRLADIESDVRGDLL